MRRGEGQIFKAEYKSEKESNSDEYRHPDESGQMFPEVCSGYLQETSSDVYLLSVGPRVYDQHYK